MANLYEINEELTNLQDAMIDPETGLINDEIFAQFDALKMERNEKVENIALWYKNLLSDAEACKAEAKAFSERAKSYESKAKGLLSYLENNLQGEKFKTTKCEIKWTHSEAVECSLADLTVLPAEYLRYKAPELNKTEVKKAIKAGNNIEGCVLVERLNMSIK